MQVSENKIFSKINLQIWTFLWRVWRTFHLKLTYWSGNTCSRQATLAIKHQAGEYLLLKWGFSFGNL